ncbi:MAG: transglutaminase-like domain-containing protein [bacterium]
MKAKGAFVMVLVFLFPCSAGAVKKISPRPVIEKKSPAPQPVEQFKKCLGKVKLLLDKVETGGVDAELKKALKKELLALAAADKQVSELFLKTGRLVSSANASSRALRTMLYRSRIAFSRYKSRLRRFMESCIELLKAPENKPPEFYQEIIVKIRGFKWLEQTLPSRSFDLGNLPIKGVSFAAGTSFEINDTLKADSGYLKPETVLTSRIKDLADKLDHDPARIRAWVDFNIKWLPIPGALWGADGCLREKAGSELDRASLLIALLRASGIPCRYVFGLSEADDRALQEAARAGLPVKGNSLGRVWVEARLSKEDSLWTPLTLSRNLPENKPQKADSGFLSGGIGKARRYSQAILTAALRQTAPDEFSKEQPAAVLPEGLPFKVTGKPIITAAVPPGMGYSVDLQLTGEEEGETVSLAWNPLQTSSQGVSIVYLPADKSEVEIIKLLAALEKKDPGFVSPGYLMKLKTYLVIGKKRIVSGPTATLGTGQTIKLTLHGPGGFKEEAVHKLRVGMHSFLAFNFGNSISGFEQGMTSRVVAWILDSLLDMGWYEDMGRLGKGYLRKSGLINRYLKAEHRVRLHNLFSENLVSESAEVREILGVPVGFAYQGTQIDVQKELLVSLRKEDRPWVKIKAAAASALEEEVCGAKGTAFSTLSLLELYQKRGTDVLRITSKNQRTALARLRYPKRIIDMVKQTVSSGGEVVMPVSLSDTDKLGYIVINRFGDSGYYMSYGFGQARSNMMGSMNTSARLSLPKRTLPMIITLVLVLGVMVFIAMLTSG